MPLTTNPDNWDSRHPFAPWNQPDQVIEEEDRNCEMCGEVLATDERGTCTDCKAICAADEAAWAAEHAKRTSTDPLTRTP